MREILEALFLRYEDMLRGAENKIPSLPMELTVENYRFLCGTALRNLRNYPTDKLNRWLGNVQAGVVLHGLTTTGAERDFTRPMFHAYYQREGLEVPPTQSLEN